MIHSDLRQTVFNIEKLRNAVNVGSFSAFQIHATPGKQLGKMGNIVNPALLTASNEEKFLADPVAGVIDNTHTYWFRNALAKRKS